MRTLLAPLAALVLSSVGAAHAADAPPLFSTQQLTPETALVAARAALAHCRAAGHQVAVAVTDRSGQVQVLLRDRFAGAHTLDIAPRKAWTAASFRMPSASASALSRRASTEPATST